ncbi:MAG: GNAT family N-acetyltransferase [Chloroflexi bacterium]|nr:GNAT family N-acetyltransferase [Chloroflexota bacterium]
MKDILTGSLVRLASLDAEELGKAYGNWRRDSEFMRLIDMRADGMYSGKKQQDVFEKMLDDDPQAHHYFSIRSLEDNRLLGDINLDVTNWSTRDAFVGLGIGERADWDKGYGTDAMNIILRFAFTEVNLRRVTLTVFEYNPRAIRSYEKAGFQHEGRIRRAILRDGKRWDVFYMGILRDDWMEKHHDQIMDKRTASFFDPQPARR